MKVDKHCSLAQVIEEMDPKFYEGITRTCMSVILKPDFRDGGVTFLYPQDSSVRKYIIDKVSTDSYEAIKTYKALALRGSYRTPEELKGSIVNKLGQVLEINGNKWGDFTIEAPSPKEFRPLDYKNNMSVLILKGKGKIPLDGKQAPKVDPAEFVKKKKAEVATGGSAVNYCEEINKKIASWYPRQIKVKNNIYVKLVAIMLGIFREDHPELYNSERFLNYFGNDFITDYYLLSMIAPPDVHEKLYRCSGEDVPNSLGDLTEDSSDDESFYQRYKRLRNERITQGKFKTDDQVKAQLQKNYSEQKQLIDEVLIAADIREKLYSAYKSQEELLGIHLFISFCNLVREMWETELDGASFLSFHYMVSNVYLNPKDLIKIQFDKCNDAFYLGNTLKTELFKFIPWPTIDVYKQVYGESNHIPKPIELKMYSISVVLDKFDSSYTGGGGPKLISKYLV